MRSPGEVEGPEDGPRGSGGGASPTANARFPLVAGAVLGLLGVAAGAFGTHGLSTRLEPRALEIFETAARYQMLHALLLVAIGGLVSRIPDPLLRWASRSILLGVVAFSGSLYLLALTGAGWLGAVAPLGGLAMISGWGLLLAAALRSGGASLRRG